MVKKDRVSQTVASVLMIPLYVCCVFPFLLLIVSSLTDENTLIRDGYSFFPEKWSLYAYKYMFTRSGSTIRGYAITVGVTVIGTVRNLMPTVLMAWSLFRKDLSHRNKLGFFVYFIMLFNGGVVPVHIMQIQVFHIKNTYLVLILPNLLMSAFYIIVTRTYFSSSILDTVVKAVRVDGAGEFRILTQVVLPTSWLTMAMLTLLVGLKYWNDWVNGLYYVTKPKYYSVQVLLNQMLKGAQAMTEFSTDPAAALSSTSYKTAIAVAGALPVLAIYLFFQRYFVKGTAIGAVKGQSINGVYRRREYMSDQALSKFMSGTQEEMDYSKAKILKFGIIGTGWIAKAYIEPIQKCPDTEITAAAEVIPGKAERFSEKFGMEGVHLYGDHKVMLETEKDLDAVHVCTYNTQHAICAIDALNAGINVALEKPMTITLDEAVQAVRVEKASGKLLSIGFQLRMDANMQMIRKIIQLGELGKVHYTQTGDGRRRGISNSISIEKKIAGIDALGDIGCYSLDVVLNAIDYPKPLTASGYTSSYSDANPNYNTPKDAARFDVDDSAVAFTRLEGGIIIDFRIAWAMHVDTSGDTIIPGMEGVLRIPSAECWNGTMGGPMKLHRDVVGKRVETEIPIETEMKNTHGLFYKKVRLFTNAARNEGGASVSSDQILLNQAISDGITRPTKAGREVEIELPKDI